MKKCKNLWQEYKGSFDIIYMINSITQNIIDKHS